METVLTITPSISPDTPDLFLDRLLHPGRLYADPDAVLDDSSLDRQEKRAILSSWASDACAVDSAPALRQPPGAARPVGFDAIMDALRSLDTVGGDAAVPCQARRDGAAPVRLHI